MKKTLGREKIPQGRSLFRIWCFPACVVAAYLILLVVTPDRAKIALQGTGRMLFQITLPLLLAFGVMFLQNLFISPAHVSRFLGQGTGCKGVWLSALAGIISMGPIFTWYPFLKSLRNKGASDFHLANFLSHRAVKPVLLPMMIIYFGWRFSLVFTVLCILNAMLTAVTVGLLGRDR